MFFYLQLLLCALPLSPPPSLSIYISCRYLYSSHFSDISARQRQKEMAIIAVSAPRGARFSCFNTNPLPQLPIASRRSSKLNCRPRGFTPFARYAQTQQDLFSSRLQDSIENIPKLMEDIAQTSINTGPRGALRLAQGVQAFLGGGGEWLADVSKDVDVIAFAKHLDKIFSSIQPHFATNKDVDVMAFAKDLEKIFSSIQDLDTELIVATARDTTTNASAVSANAVVDERQMNALFLDLKVSELVIKGNYKYFKLDGEAQSWNHQRVVVARGKANSERNGVDFDSDEENGNGGGGGGDQEPFDWEKVMRKRVKEIEERRELEKKAEELQSRIMDDNSQEEKQGSEEEKKERVRKELEKVAMEQAERRATAELMFELGQKAYGKGMYGRAIEFLEASLTIIPRSTLFGGEIQIWLAMAYEANNRHADCIALYKQLEMKHPSISIRRQAANLRYILQAPKLKISEEEMVTIPLIGSTYDSYAASWSDKYKDKDQESSWTTSNQLPSSRDFIGDFLIWRPPTGLQKNRAFWVALALWMGLVGVALFLQR
ncbi:N-terminal acetyltransferase A, auxiliary [Salix suchowensis]|nr:N-terminal acetyltransferase A, auxiliary [Salix suchowensis]